jgi:2-iminobutanoate/2-iminopropanoate deaminase
MDRVIVSSPNAPAAIGPYSQAVKASFGPPGAAMGGLVFCSGQIPLDPKTGQMVGDGDVEAEAHQVMKNLSAVLEAAGSSLDKVLKTTIFLTDLSDFSKVNGVYGGYFAGITPPARATVQVAALPRGAKVEIELVALA